MSLHFFIIGTGGILEAGCPREIKVHLLHFIHKEKAIIILLRSFSASYWVLYVYVYNRKYNKYLNYTYKVLKLHCANCDFMIFNVENT